METSIHAFHGVSYNFFKGLLVSASNGLFCVIFKVLQAPWVTADLTAGGNATSYMLGF